MRNVFDKLVTDTHHHWVWCTGHDNGWVLSSVRCNYLQDHRELDELDGSEIKQYLLDGDLWW